MTTPKTATRTRAVVAKTAPTPKAAAVVAVWILRPVRASVPLWREPPFRGGVSHLDAVG